MRVNVDLNLGPHLPRIFVTTTDSQARIGAGLTGGAGMPGGNMMFQMIMMMMAASDNKKSNCEEKSDVDEASAESSSEKCLEDNIKTCNVYPV